MLNDPLAARVLEYVRRPNYQPVKPRVIAKKLELDAEQTQQLRRVVKQLVRAGQLRYGASHVVRLPQTPRPSTETTASSPPRSTEARPERSPSTKKRRPEVSAAETDEPVFDPEACDEEADDPRELAEDEAGDDLDEGFVDVDDADDEEPTRDAAERSAGRTEPQSRSKPLPQDGRHLSGVFRRVAAGYGFVRPAGTDPQHGRDKDIMIPAERCRDAANGDTVLVRLSRTRGREGKRQGEILEVLERDTHQFVGTYFEAEGVGYVLVDGKVFSQPISVGDPGAHNVQADDKVVIEMIRFPSHAHDGEGVITHVLGARGTPGVDTLTVIHEFNLPDAFPEAVLAEARAEAERFDENDLSDRRDLTAETIITIDPVDARDFDDAISLEILEGGHWRLGVHIADVAHFVRRGSLLDDEAHTRATSVYLPDRVLPMLPEVISNGLASLQPHRVRYAKTAFIEFTPDGAPVEVELQNTAIRSQRRFTYEEVDDYLADPETWRGRLTAPVHALLERMHRLAMILRQRRLEAGALELSLPEVKIDLDREGKVAGAHVAVNTVSHQMIEEFMLAANIAVAERLRAAGVPFLRRVHGAPDPRKLKSLGEFVRELRLTSGDLQSRFELQKLLYAVAERPERQAVNYATLRSLQRAVYSPEEEGHFALAVDHYCHFTSPIRRYPDLTIHRLVDALAAGKKPKSDQRTLVVLGEHCSERERRAEDAERELTKIKLLEFLSDRIGEEFDAVVTGVESFGLFAQGIDLPAEGLVPVASLADDFYRYDRAAHSLIGNRAGNTFRLGDKIRVRVARVDVDRRELDFRLANMTPGRRARPPRADETRQRPGRVRSVVHPAKSRTERTSEPRRTKKATKGSKGTKGTKGKKKRR